MCPSISLLFVLGVVASDLITAFGSHVHTYRKYGNADPSNIPLQINSKVSSTFPVLENLPLHLQPIPRYPSIKRSSTFRVKQPNPTVIANHAPRILNRGVGRPFRVHIQKPLGYSVPQSRPGPFLSTSMKRTGQNELRPPHTKTNGVKMKPVYEEGILQRKPVYINSFPELTQSESSKDVRNLNYEPLGEYALF